MKTSIIIPVHDGWEYTEMCLRSIGTHTAPWEYEVIIIDNGSPLPITYSDIDGLLQGETTIIHNKKNMGFPVACNLGAKIADHDLICFLNNDTVVTPDWLQHLKFYIEQDMLDIVGPTTNSISGPQMKTVDPYNNDAELNALAQKIYAENCEKLVRHYRIVGFCMLMHRNTWNAAGPFDEAYSPGNFEDDDLCLNAIDKGFRLGYASDVFIHHFGSATMEAVENLKTVFHRNQKLFNSKWSAQRITELVYKNGG